MSAWISHNSTELFRWLARVALGSAIVVSLVTGLHGLLFAIAVTVMAGIAAVCAIAILAGIMVHDHCAYCSSPIPTVGIRRPDEPGMPED